MANKATLYVTKTVAGGACAPQITVKGVKVIGQTISKENPKVVSMKLPMKDAQGETQLINVPFIMSDTNGIHQSHQAGEVETPNGTQAVSEIFDKLFQKLASKPGATIGVEYEISDSDVAGGSVSLDDFNL